MRHLFAFFILLFAVFACTSCLIARDEVVRVTSPSEKLDAILIETNGGATTSFGYEVYLARKGASEFGGIKVASLYGATRNNGAYGANLKWEGSQLTIEYLKAKSAEIVRREGSMSSEQFSVALREGVNDPNAPDGGMHHNLQKKTGE